MKAKAPNTTRDYLESLNIDGGSARFVSRSLPLWEAALALAMLPHGKLSSSSVSMAGLTLCGFNAVLTHADSLFDDAPKCACFGNEKILGADVDPFVRNSFLSGALLAIDLIERRDSVKTSGTTIALPSIALGQAIASFRRSRSIESPFSTSQSVPIDSALYRFYLDAANDDPANMIVIRSGCPSCSEVVDLLDDTNVGDNDQSIILVHDYPETPPNLPNLGERMKVVRLHRSDFDSLEVPAVPALLSMRDDQLMLDLGAIMIRSVLTEHVS